MNKKDLYLGAAFSIAALIIIYLPWQLVQTLGVAALLLTLLVVQYRNLTLGFVLTLFFLPFSLRLNLSQTNDALSFDMIFLLFDNLALIVAWRLWQRRENPFGGWPRLALGATVFFFVAILMSFVVSIDHSITIRKLWNVGQYAVGLGVMLALWREYGLPLLKRSLWALLGTGGLLSLYSLVLFYLQWPLGDAWNMRLWLIDHTVEILHGVRTASVFKSGDNNWILINGPLRAVGTFPTPMGLGQYLFVSLILAAAFILTAPTHIRLFGHSSKPKLETGHTNATAGRYLGVNNRAELVFCYIVLILALTTEIATYSRGVWFGAILGLAVILGLSLFRKVSQASPKLTANFKKLLIPFVIIMAVIVVIYAADTVLPLPYAQSKINSTSSYSSDQVQLNNRFSEALDATNESNQVRFKVWGYAIDLFREHPIFGRGLGTFAVNDKLDIASQPKNLQSPIYSSTYAHNIYLDFLAETGAVGLLAYLLLIGLSVFYAWQIWRRANPDWQIIGAAIIAITAAMALHNIFDDMFIVPKNGLTIFMLIALAFVGKLQTVSQPALIAEPTPSVATVHV